MSMFKVSVIGAGMVGATTAQRIAESGLADVTLVDIVEGMPQGKSLDLRQCVPALGRGAAVQGSNDFKAIEDSNVVVMTAGFPRKPGMSREELLAKNASIVTGAAEAVAKHSPNAILVVVTNPLDIMTYLAWKRSGLPCGRVVGMAGVLDASRFITFVADKLGVSPMDIRATVLGGHGNLMLILPRYSSVAGVPLPNLLAEKDIEALVERARNGGAEIVSLLKTGSAYYAPSASVAIMVESILADQKRVLCASAHLDGEYGLNDIYVGVPVKLGASGVEEVFELPLCENESAALHASAEKIRAGIELGL